MEKVLARGILCRLVKGKRDNALRPPAGDDELGKNRLFV